MKISVVITAYNVERYIREAVESVLNQTYKNIEVVVVDDKSTDSTSKILKSYGDKIRVISNEINKGAGASRRVGIQSSTGEYILLLDGDDWLEPDFIESLYQGVVETGADIVSGGIMVNHENGVVDTTNYGKVVTEGVDKVIKFWGERIVFMNNKLIHRKLHDAIPYCERRFIEDTPTIIPLLALANKVAYVPNCGYHYRMNSTSLTHTSSAFKTTLFRLLCVKDLMAFFNKYDKEYLKTIPMGLNYTQLLIQLKSLKITPEMISEYLNEWNEMTLDLLTKLS